MVPRVEACDVMKSRKKSRDIVNFVEFASDVPLSVDGTVLDPVPAEGEFGVPAGESVGEEALQRLIEGVWTLQALGRARA